MMFSLERNTFSCCKGKRKKKKIYIYIYTQLWSKQLLVSRGMLKMSRVSYRIFCCREKQLIIGNTVCKVQCP